MATATIERQDAIITAPAVSDGTTKIEDSVVSKVAGIAANEIDGVQLGGSASRAVGGLLDSVTGPSESRGVSVEVGEIETAIDIKLAITYGRAIPQVTDAVRRNVVKQVEKLVGLSVTGVNITVTDVIVPDAVKEQFVAQTEREKSAVSNTSSDAAPQVR